MAFADITFGGVTFRMDTLGGADQSARDMIAGVFEPPLPAVLMATLARFDGAFLDVGANSGVYSILSGVMFPSRTVLCFEPAPNVLAVLKRNLEQNGLLRTTQVHELALSDRNGKAALYFPADNVDLLDTSPTLERGFHASLIERETVTSRLDDILGIPEHISALKIDVEGHEHCCLAGAYSTISKSRPFIFCEVLRIAKFEIIEEFFRELSYLNVRLRPDLAIYEQHVSFDPNAWNHAFIPGEKIQAFKEIVEGCGLQLV